MRIFKSVVVTAACIAPVCFCGAQTAQNAAPTSPTAAAAASNVPAVPAGSSPVAPSSLLSGPLDEVHQVVAGVRLDKWKRGSVREQAGNNIDAIQRDMKGTLPSLLKDADAAPGSLSKVLPLSRNVDALYDVLVHLVEEARVSGTGEDAGQLQQVMGDLEKARVALDNQILQTATVQEKQIVDLRTTVQKQEVSLRAAATPPPAPKCPAPTPVKKKRPAAKKPATNPTAGTSTTPPKPQ